MNLFYIYIYICVRVHEFLLHIYLKLTHGKLFMEIGIINLKFLMLKSVYCFKNNNNSSSLFKKYRRFSLGGKCLFYIIHIEIIEK